MEDNEDLTLPALLQQQSALRPDALALLAPGRIPLTYDGLWRQSAQLASHLRARGVQRTARVAVLLPNGPEMATAFLGVASGAACAPFNPAFQAAELRFFLKDTQACAVVVDRATDGPIRTVAPELGLEIIELDVGSARPAGDFRIDATGNCVDQPLPCGSDLALLLHTSGTTARPKIVPLSHANIAASARSIAKHLALSPDDRCLNVMPLFHIHGLIGALLASLAGGASVVCTGGYDPNRFFEWVAEFKPTWFTAVPTIHQSVVTHGAGYRRAAPQHRFRFVRSSSAALPSRTFDALQSLTGAPVIEAFGMTEASHEMASNPIFGPQKPGSVGVPTGAEIAIMDEEGCLLETGATGEIVVRGPGVTAGYENNPEANRRAFCLGWFRTGDQGRIEEDGFLRVTGRLKEIINRGGEKISPREIDEALLEHPSVSQAAAFALPHDSLGEDLAAVVVLREGLPATESELRAFLFGRIAEVKIPSTIVFTASIPVGPTGKIRRSTLAQALAGQLQRAYIAPRDAMERILETIFVEVLGSTPIGVEDNFFLLGGDSLKAVQVVSRIQAHWGVEIPVATLFRHPTIAALAVAVGDALAATENWTREMAAEIDRMSDDEVARILALEEAAQG